MMKLNLMREIVDTLNDSWESAVADEILSNWKYDRGTAKFLRSSANFLFTFTQSDRNYVLRFNHSSERTPNYIQAELEYLHHLSAAGIPVAKPIQSLSGNYLESVRTSHGVFHAVVFEALAGQQFEITELTPEMFVRWGKALGELHQASQSYSGSGRPAWQDHLAIVSESLPTEEKAARKTLDILLSQVSELAIHEHNFGLIHFDFELDNVIWNGNHLGLIDFDDSAWYWFVADIAFALRDLFDDRAAQLDLNSEAFLSFIKGYRIAKDIAQEELQFIPLFLRMHQLITFAKLLRTLEAGEQNDESAWLGQLRQKLSMKMKDYRVEFSKYTQ
jgi:Ser/Thr protein kinase RdoA (MazF antagonist)